VIDKIEKTDIIPVRSSHQPSTAKLDKVIDVREEDRTMPQAKGLAEAVLCDVNIRWKDWP